MSESIEKLEEIQTKVLDTVGQVHDPVVDAVRTAAERAESVVPEVTVPFADRLPTAEAIIANQFDFLTKVIEQQRAFAEALLAAVKPVSDKVVLAEAEAPKSTAKSTAKKAA
ncbi:MAG: hypothetical protein JJU45_07060 [Acidimicrobiia bacterium]|nr:hypothetical protein [Acidimicrobiia bacterium]